MCEWVCVVYVNGCCMERIDVCVYVTVCVCVCVCMCVCVCVSPGNTMAWVIFTSPNKLITSAVEYIRSICCVEGRV